ncbi:MAG: transporter substrate-binding domain-containing protein [Treponema sp.]|nr:transporter substrate-binding domain-containing protein [Treponema sp.]MCL2271493.1 transporter substrate-binding domain-containing protein [Treponema sp.]
MKMNVKYLLLLLPLTLLTVFCSDCVKKIQKSGSSTVYSSYRDIPGVTAEEISAIETFREKREPFVYGMLVNTETFPDANGEIRGFTALLCEWMSELFGIKFIPRHFTWLDLLNGLESGHIDFTGELTANEERRKIYHMTDTMAQRSLKYFRIKDSIPFSEINRTRLPRYILQEKTTIADDVLHYAGGTFEPVFIFEYDEAYEILKAGEADALITESVQEAFWDSYGDITAGDFFPLIYSPVSLSTQNPSLEPFISVMQKALDNNGFSYINELYDQGYREYKKNKLMEQLTAEELEYMLNNPVIPFAAEFDNYPVSFYNTQFNEWQGISFDVLKELESLTGLKFNITHNENTVFHELLQMLENGEVCMLTEVIRSDEREGRFLWPSNSFMTERSVLVSKLNHRNTNVNRIYSETVALSRGTVQTEFFYRWFPNHPHVIIYDNYKTSFEALINDEVDLVMSSYSQLLYLTNYLELSGFKANVIFDNSFESSFGINKNQKVLCSIIDKALELVDTGTISEQWRHRSYDYRLKVVQARTPWLMGSIILSLCVLSLVIVLFVRNRRAGREMETLVKKQTNELALQTTTLTTLFDSIPDLIFTKNLKLNFLHCNKAFLEHFAKTIDDLVGKSDEDGLEITSEDARGFNDFDRQVINECRSITIEEHIPCHDGTKPIYETIKMPLMMNDEVVGVMGIARNITKRKEMEEAALAASHSKSSFLANMSHEIRTPMNVIMGVTELLIQNEKLPGDIEEGLNKIYTSCDMLLGIINDILDFSKIEAGKLDIMPTQYNVASMISDSIHLNMMRIESKPIEFELQINEEIPAKLIGDELRIKQILNNLLSNAFKYTDTGKVTLSVESVRKEEGVIIILSVQDTGHGMTKEQLSKLYEEYSRFDQGTKSSVEGTGLGLAITQRLIHLMNGEISVESEPGKGTLFIVKLPQETVDSELLSKDVASDLREFRRNYITQKKRGQVIRDPMPYGSVLVVDDVETNLYVAVGLMKLYRMQIDTAMSGLETLEKIKNGKSYDIIFMDHMMPEMDGIETTKNLRNYGYKYPIVALTANAVAGQASLFMRNGFDGFISKPIDTRQLNSILNKFVRDRHPQEVIEAARRQITKTSSDTVIPVDPLLIESFLRDSRKTITWLDEMCGKDGFENDEILRKFTIIVHGIKSSLWNIGEKKMAVTAEKLEKDGRDQNAKQISESTPEFVNELKQLVERLEREQEELHANEDEDTDYICEKLKAIEVMCHDYNRKGAIALLGEIKKCSKETKAVLEKIMQHTLHSEFEEAGEAAVAHYESLSHTNNKTGTRLLKEKIDGLDIKKGLERYEGDGDIYLKVLRSYTSSIRSMLEEVEDTGGNASIDNYRIKVHGIKGTSLDISAEPIGIKAKELEEAAKAGNWDYIREHNPSLLEAGWKLIGDLEKMISKIDAENPKPIKDKPDEKALSALLAACKGYEMDDADAAMALLEKYQYTSDDGLVNWLRETIDRMDFAKIVNKLSGRI